MTLFPRLGTHWPFRYSLLVKISIGIASSSEVSWTDESLISSFELSDNSSGGLLQIFYDGGVRATP